MDGALIRAQCEADDLRAVKEAIGHRPSLLSDRVDTYGGTLLHEACRYVLFLMLVKRKAALFFWGGVISTLVFKIHVTKDKVKAG